MLPSATGRSLSSFSRLFARAAAGRSFCSPASTTAPAASNAPSGGRVDSRDFEIHPVVFKLGTKTGEYDMPHAVYTPEDLSKVKITHYEPTRTSDKVALKICSGLRWLADKTLEKACPRKEDYHLTRFVILETIAAVPGMVAGAVRHMRSLRYLKRDHGWIHTLLAEAENERMHLLTWLQYRQPGVVLRVFIIVAQWIFYNLYFWLYLFFPKTSHRFIGYIEEEAVKSYTHFLEDLDAGKLPRLQGQPAPKIAISYWLLNKDATIREVAEAVRADEVVHRDVNHTFSKLDANETNPHKL